MENKASFLTHINGIRALAILAVLLYHLNNEYCSAGYFGVDVFLVVSGWLLFKSLMNEKKALHFEYGNYLLHKAWRILPSWFVCCSLVTALAFVLEIPQDSVKVVKTAGASSCFVSDFFFSKTYNYFDDTAHLNPLLHFWYLSITAQLYILAPLIVIPFMRFKAKKALFLFLGILGALSLAFYILTTSSLYTLSKKLLSSIYASTPYYHLLPRFWELIAGAFIISLPAFPGFPRLRNALAFLGIAGFLFSCFFYETGSFMSYIPVASALLMVRYGDAGSFSRLMSWRPLQWVGSISFSLYLWHWPVIVLWKYYCFTEVTVMDECLMLLLSFLLACLAWRFVERIKAPAVRTRYARCKNAILLMSMPLTLVSSVCLFTSYYTPERKFHLNEVAVQMDGMDGPRDAEIFRGLDRSVFRHAPIYCGSDFSLPPDFLLIGDSHALHLQQGLQNACNRHRQRGITLNAHTVPFWDLHQSLWTKDMQAAFARYVESKPSLRYVIISASWTNRIPDDDDFETKMEALSKTCRFFNDKGIRVILTIDTPRWHLTRVSPYIIWARCKWIGLPDPPRQRIEPKEYEELTSYYVSRFRKMKNEGIVHALIDLNPPLMEEGGPVSRKGSTHFYRDSNHYTRTASNLVAEHLIQEFIHIKQMDEASSAP